MLGGAQRAASAREKANDKSFVGAAQPVAGRCILQCVHIDRRCPAARRASAAAGAAPAAAPALPPGSPLIGRPAGNEAAAKLAPVAPPPIAAAPDKLPTAKLKVPAGFNIEVYAAGMANARSLAVGDKGTVFVGSRLVDKVYAIVNKDGKREVKVLASGLYRPNGIAFKDGTLYIAELSKVSKIDKVEDNPGQPAEADRDLRQAAKGRGPWLEVHRHRPRQQALRSGRPARQQRAARRRARPDPPDESRRLRRRSDRPGRPQYRRLRLESRDQAALLHRQRPRLDVGRRARGRAQPHHQGRRAFRRALLPAGQYRRSRIRLGQILQRIHRARRPAGSAFRSPRHALLYRQHVPEGLQERGHHRPARLVEPVEEGWR